MGCRLPRRKLRAMGAASYPAVLSGVALGTTQDGSFAALALLVFLSPRQ